MNSWCESCARKSHCYTADVRPKCYVAITSNDRDTINHCNNCQEFDCFGCVDTPTIDAVSVVHGEWIDKGWKGDWQFETDGKGNCWYEYECSECGFRNKGSKSNYCPNCGAKMKGEDDKESE